MNHNNTEQYIIPLMDVSGGSMDDDDDDDDCSSDSECLEDASSYHSEPCEVMLNDDTEHDDDASSSGSSSTSASVSVASNDRTADQDFSSSDEEEEEEEEETTSSGSDYDDDDTSEDELAAQETEDDDDDTEDWNMKYFPHETSQIRFSPDVTVYDTLTRGDYTAREKMAAFLTAKDKKAQWFYQNKAIARLEWWLEETPDFRAHHRRRSTSTWNDGYNVVNVVEGSDSNNDTSFVPRGLHQMTDKGYDRMNYFKNACVDAVLQEQENQWKAAGGHERTGLLMWEFEKMAAVSMQVSRGGIMEAIKIAKRDRQQAEKAYIQMEREEEKKKKKQQKRLAKSNNSPLAAITNNQKIQNNVPLTAARTSYTESTAIEPIKKNPVKHLRSPSPLTTPTTVTTTLTSSHAGSSLNMESEASSSSGFVLAPVKFEKEQEEEEQPLDYLEVASVDSAPSLLTLDDGASVQTPPAEEENETAANTGNTELDLKQQQQHQYQQYRKRTRRLSMEEQQHPMLALREKGAGSPVRNMNMIAMGGGRLRMGHGSSGAPPSRRKSAPPTTFAQGPSGSFSPRRL